MKRKKENVLGRRRKRPRLINLRKLRPQHRKRSDLCREDYRVEHECGDECARGRRVGVVYPWGVVVRPVIALKVLV